jgi:hypothetical protein
VLSTSPVTDDDVEQARVLPRHAARREGLDEHSVASALERPMDLVGVLQQADGEDVGALGLPGVGDGHGEAQGIARRGRGHGFDPGRRIDRRQA